MAELPLDGIRIIELTQIAAGPYSTQFLGDWGAEVIRLENLQTMRPGTRGQYAKVSQGLVDQARASNAPGMVLPQLGGGPTAMEQVHPVHRHSQEQEEHDGRPAQAGGQGDTGQAGQYGGRIHREQRAGDRGKAGHQLRVAEGAETRHRHDSYARVRADRAVLKLQVPGAARRRRCRPPSHQELPRRGSPPGAETPWPRTPRRELRRPSLCCRLSGTATARARGRWWRCACRRTSYPSWRTPLWTTR